MKNFKKMMAFALAMVMVLAMALPAMAADTTGAPTSGSITINSPIVGATYKVYKIFDMTTNADVDAFSYTIDTDNDFYGAVVEYAGVAANGLTLSRIEGSDPAKYNVSVDKSKFDAQKFGKAMQAVLENGSPAATADQAYTDSEGKKGIAPKAAGGAKIAEDYSKVCTITEDNTSDQLVFGNEDADEDGTADGIPLGYYLINPTYPQTAAKTVTMGSGAAAQTFEDADLVKDANGVATGLTTGENSGTSKVAAYVDATVTTEYVNQYITDHGITRNEDGSPLNADGRAAIMTKLKTSMTEDAVKKILAAFNGENGAESDLNVKEPILVFLDSSKPDAVINEKNELDKWDVPVNPQGEASEGTPEHGEPEGGKNIVAGTTTNGDAIYADWSDAEIGESVHYQLRVNAMNFIRTGNTDDTIEQVKEYILADFQSAHMHFDEAKGLHVSIWQGDNANDSQASTKSNVTSDQGLTGIANATYETTGSVDGVPYPSINYTEYAKGDPKNAFFKNATEADGTAATTTDIFGTTETGIVVPWVIVSEEDLSATYPIYTITNIPKEENGQPVYKTEELKKDSNNQSIPFKIQNAAPNDDTWTTVDGAYVSVNNHVVDQQGRVIDTNADGTLKTDDTGAFLLVKDTKPVYTYSIYNSDVTIVVDYWMILDDDAVVDEPGNKNFAQYGWNPVDNEDENGNPKTPSTPKDDDKPSQKEEVDEATVYTYALAWVKIDEQGNELADAEFELPFYVKKGVKDGKSYIYGVSAEDYATLSEADKANYTNKVTTTTAAADGEKGVITIKGVEQGEYTIKETQAPAGFNPLTEPFTIEAKKSGPSVTTTTKTTIFLDAQGNVTDTVTNVTKEYKTDEDTYNKATPSVAGEETSVPVYQYKHITNKQGTELPSTGGIGTTIFYVIGAILVLGAGILLVTRRRMNAN